MKKILKRISCFMIVFLLVFTSVLSTLSIGRSNDNSIVLSTKADTDSNDRRKALIHMAAGKNATDLSKEGELSLTDEELQTIGIFLSNFYKPMQTCVNAVNKDDNKKFEEQEIDALVSCGFDREIASALAKAVKKYSSATAAEESTKLTYTLKYKEKGGANKENDQGTAYYPNFLNAMKCGGEFKWNGKTIIDFGRAKCDKSNSAIDGTSKCPFNLTSDDIPSSTKLMICCLYNLMDVQNGQGKSIIPTYLDTQTSGSLENVLINIYENNAFGLQDSDLENLGIQHSELHIDCFGNIIVNNKLGQFVLVPACMNPYVFQTKVGDKTKNSYNLVNLQTVYNVDSIIEKETTECIKDDKKTSQTVRSLMFKNTTPLQIILGNNADDHNDKYMIYYKADKCKSLDGAAINHDKLSLTDDSLVVKSLYGGATQGFLKIECFSNGSIVTHDESHGQKGNGNRDIPYLPTARGNSEDLIRAYVYANSDSFNYIYKAGTYSDGGKARSGFVEDFLQIDDLGSYEGDDESEDGISRVDFYPCMAAAKSSVTTQISLSGGDNYYTKISESGKIFAQNIFLTYVYAFSNYKNNTWDARGITSKLNIGDSLPKPNSKGIFDEIELDTTQQLLDEGLSLAVLWMHPEKGLELVTAWVNNKVSSVLTGVHEKILGSNIANNTTATNKYIGFSGYVTMPELNDLSWTAAILEKYNSYSVLIIVIMIILLFGYAMIGRIAPFKIVTTGLIFAFLMALPPVLINGTISITNQFSDKLYGQKFIYWGLVQHENYISDINEAANSGSYEDYLTTLFQKRYAENNSTNSNVSIRLKWMCPKKDNYVQNLKETVEGDTGSAFFSQIVGALSNSSGITHEDYSESDNKVYLYRSYTDISNWARYTYMAYAGEENWVEQSVDGVPSIKKYTDENLSTAKDLGFSYKGVAEDPLNRLKPLNCSVTIKDYLDKYTSSDAIKKKANLDTFLGIPTESFKALNQINNGDADTEDLAITYFSELSESPFYFFTYNLYDQGMDWENDDATEGFKCLALNESFDNASSTTNNDVEEGDSDSEADSDDTDGVTNPDVADTINEVQEKQEEQEKEAAKMGDKTNDGYFYNMSQGIVDKGGNGYGEIRDYMDMRTLFTVVIPYLKECNDMVLDYDKAFGLRTYDGYSYNPNDGSNYESKEDKRKFWVNVCTAQMFNLYTPWVDAMYDCKYAKSENVRVAGKKEFVEDPLNPADYPKDRPMIFSESERVYYGIKETQLTSVEQKIIEIEKNSYERLFQLMNYYTFHDTVITSAAAMIETFEFNKAFSQDSLLSDSYVLYPQAYELKNFSYDAFLRLILAQSTGEEIQASASDGSLTNKGGNIYERVVKNSNMFCGLMLILNDAICIWLIPLAKFLFLILIFAMSIVMLISCIIKIDISNMQATITKSLITPLAKFLALTIGHSFVISCFMSEGNTAVTGATFPAITLGDPTMTLILMALINSVVIFLFLKILIKLIHDTVTYVKAIGQDVVGMAGGVLTMATGAVRNAYNSVRGVGRSALGGLFAAGAGLAAGATLAKGSGSKVKNRGGNKGGGASGSGTDSGDNKSSNDGLEPCKTKEKDNKKGLPAGENKYDKAIKDGNVKEAETASVNKDKGVVSKVKRTIGDIHAINKDKRSKKKEERYNNASEEEKKKIQRKRQRKVGRDAFVMKTKDKVKGAGRKVKGIGTGAKNFAKSKKTQFKNACSAKATEFRSNADKARSNNAKRKKTYNDIVKYEASKPKRKKK